MPGFHPTDYHSKKPWRARVSRDGIVYFLGYFATREEAKDREAEFRKAYPPRINRQYK